MSRLSRLVNVVRGDRVDRDVDDELAFHLEARRQDLIADGMTPRDADREARRRFGNILNVRESVRDTMLATWLDSIRRDARFGLRMLAKDRIATAAAVFSLALAIGTSTAAFLMVDALVLRPLPVYEPDRLFHLTYTAAAGILDGRPGAFDAFSYPAFERMREAARGRARLFGVAYGGPQQMAAFDSSPGSDEQVRVQWIGGEGLSILGVQPALGRLLNAADEFREGETGAVLSHAFWMRRFGGSPDVLGRAFTLTLREMHSARFRVAGVAAKGFHGLEPGEPVDMWVPLSTRSPASYVRKANFAWFHIRGRLLPGASRDQVRDALQPVFQSVRADPSWQLRVVPAVAAPSYMRSLFERPFWIVTAVALVVVLIAGVNVASLFAARAEARRREMGLRTSIGAGRARLVQQMLVETGMVAAIAAALGLGIALAAARAIVPRLKSPDFPAYLDLRPDWRVLGFLLLVTLLATLVAGLAPALRASTVSMRRSSISRPLVAIQVACSFFGLFFAGLLLVSFRNLTGVNPGFAKDDVILCSIYPREAFGLQKPATAQRLLESVRRMPDVRAASLSTSGLVALPASRSGKAGTYVRGRELKFMRLNAIGASPGFFETMRIPLRGREFLFTGTPEPPSHAIVNDAFGRATFPGEEALGKHFEMTGRSGMQPFEIIGVVPDATYNDLRDAGMPAVFLPFLSVNQSTLEVRVSGDAVARIPSLREEIHKANPAVRITSAITQSARIDDSMRRDRLLALIAALLGAIALVVAAVGLYGVLNYSVVRRTREIGVRLALGAPYVAVVRLVMSDILWMTGVGVVIGLAAGIALARPLTPILFHVKPSDFQSVAIPLACMLAASGLAALPAAIRAVRVSPLIALRQD